MLGVVAGERVARGDALGGDQIEDLVDGSVEADRELAGDRRVVQQLDPVDRGQALARVGGAADQQLAQLDDPAAAEPGEVDRPGERVQRLRRADVVGRLLAADVLLAGLQREHEAAPAVGVGGLAGDPPGHPAQVLLGRGEEAERGAAEVEPVAERLALADRDVHPALARRTQDPEGGRVDRGNAERILGVRGRRQRFQVLDRAEEVRVRDEDGGDVGVDVVLELGGIGDAVAQPDLDHLGVEAARVGLERRPRVRVQPARDDQALAALAGAERQVGGGRDRGRALVQRGVRDRQPGELRDRGLELEHDLQPALRDLGLVRRVRGQELGARDDRVDERRDVVVVHPGADEADLRVGVRVARGERRQLLEDLGLGEPVGELERAVEAQLGRDVGEQLGRRIDPDLAQHRRPVGVGCGRVATHRNEASGPPGERGSAAAVQRYGGLAGNAARMSLDLAGSSWGRPRCGRRPRRRSPPAVRGLRPTLMVAAAVRRRAADIAGLAAVVPTGAADAAGRSVLPAGAAAVARAAGAAAGAGPVGRARLARRCAASSHRHPGRRRPDVDPYARLTACRPAAAGRRLGPRRGRRPSDVVDVRSAPRPRSSSARPIGAAATDRERGGGEGRER